MDLFRASWDGGAQLYGRRGQGQKGIDIYGTHKGEHVAVQCKKRQGELSLADVEADVERTRSHETPFQRLTFATTAARDTKVQDQIRAIKTLFEVEALFWEDLVEKICEFPEVFRRWATRLGSTTSLVSPSRLTHAADRLFGRETELAALDDAWPDPATHA